MISAYRRVARSPRGSRTVSAAARQHWRSAAGYAAGAERILQRSRTDQNFTGHNASKAIQVDVNSAWFKSGWRGTHNFKFGYQLNHLNNNIYQHYNVPIVQYFVGTTASTYTPFGPDGASQLRSRSVAAVRSDCTGQYGYINVLDYGSGGQATSFNHCVFRSGFLVDTATADDQCGSPRREGISAGREPARGRHHSTQSTSAGETRSHPVSALRGIRLVKAARMKIFGGYGQFYDQMKLNLAISSFGGQYWSNCYYASNTPDVHVNQSGVQQHEPVLRRHRQRTQRAKPISAERLRRD